MSQTWSQSESVWHDVSYAFDETITINNQNMSSPTPTYTFNHDATANKAWGVGNNNPTSILGYNDTKHLSAAAKDAIINTVKAIHQNNTTKINAAAVRQNASAVNASILEFLRLKRVRG